jgi:ABC-type bacteriocin/lantibiotic exporter with double-glycine peptidase domain
LSTISFNTETELLFNRIEEDEQNLSDALIGLTEVVEGKKVYSRFGKNYLSSVTADVVEQILLYCGKAERVDPEELSGKTEEERIHSLTRFFDKRGLSIHEVQLKKGWSQNALGPMIISDNEKKIYAAIPNILGNYHYVDYKSGKSVKITKKNEEKFDRTGICFLRQFEKKKLGIKDLLLFMVKSLIVSDIVMAIVLGLFAILVSLIVPFLIRSLFFNLDDYKSTTPIIAYLVFMVCTSLSVTLFRTVQSQMIYRMSSKVDRDTRAATMERMLSLPTDFFKNHSAGAIAKRIQIFPMLCESLITGVFTTGLMTILSIFYIFQIYDLGGDLFIVASVTTILNIGLTFLIIRKKSDVNAQRIEYATKDNAILVSMMNGIQTLKVTSSERRLYTQWLKIFKQEAVAEYRPGFIVVYGNVLVNAVSLIGILFTYIAANQMLMYTNYYIAFTALYGMLTGVFTQLQDTVPNAALVVPILKSLEILFEEKPEESDNNELEHVVPNRIEFDNVSFKYAENLPLVIKKLNLSIKEGEYVAIVGKSGCGKSTIMRLILGFEQCTLGSIYINGVNIKSIDKKSLRRNYGVVMQDSRLFSGTILKNISIANPQMTEEEAWEAARKAGIADDIENMPMKMHTIVDENASCISGGQKQRIIIARALAGNPKLLLFDEATSALDNITQKVVSDSLSELKCTRIVIAHRLSTIKDCDRIIMIDDGNVAEMGTYEQLMAKNGKFAQMVERQKL